MPIQRLLMVIDFFPCVSRLAGSPGFLRRPTDSCPWWPEHRFEASTTFLQSWNRIQVRVGARFAARRRDQSISGSLSQYLIQSGCNWQMSERSSSRLGSCQPFKRMLWWQGIRRCAKCLR